MDPDESTDLDESAELACAHTECMCPAGESGFCSPYCEKYGDEAGDEHACECGHADCAVE